ncbi:hypothetical protein MTO96_041817 [Rhipicephalus appendiculatus]
MEEVKHCAHLIFIALVLVNSTLSGRNATKEIGHSCTNTTECPDESCCFGRNHTSGVCTRLAGFGQRCSALDFYTGIFLYACPCTTGAFCNTTRYACGPTGMQNSTVSILTTM